MSLCPLRNVKLALLSGQDWRGGGSGVIAEVELSRRQDRRLPPPPLEKLPFFSLGCGGGWNKEGQLQCCGYPFCSAIAVLGVPSPNLGMAARPPH